MAKASKSLRDYRTFLKEYDCITKQTKTTRICFKCYWLFWEIKFICNIRISVESRKEMRGCPPYPRPPHFLNEVKRNSLRFASQLVTSNSQAVGRGWHFPLCRLPWFTRVFQNSWMVLLSQMYPGGTQVPDYTVSLALHTECDQVGYKDMVYRYQNLFSEKLQ